MKRYKVETPDGDVWMYDDLEEARRATYIFGGTITKIEERKKVMEWISCKERLPDDERRVLCCTVTKSGAKNIVLGYYAERWVCGMNSNVIAWMELPEPYESEVT